VSPVPIPMVLHCPRCGTQHIDAPDPESGWTNPPHRSHLCGNVECQDDQGRRTIWRPSELFTTGVARLAQVGSSDTWQPSAEPPAPNVVLPERSPLRQENQRLREALTKINDIRNDIVGRQTINWSAHIYPLVTALHEAGFEGLGYDEARRRALTLLDAVKRLDNVALALRRMLDTEKRDLAALDEELGRLGLLR